MSDRSGFEDFAAKWRARWPEWGIAEVFAPVAQRDVAAAWFALLQEFADAAWGGSDPAPGLAKLAWWQEELRGWAKGAHRHPLGTVLRPRPASWSAIADAMPALRYRELPLDPAAALAVLDPLGRASAEIEAVLFDAPSAATGSVMAMLGNAAVNAGGAEAAAALRASWPGGHTFAIPVRLRDQIVRRRLAAAAAGADWQPATRWGTLWGSWRAARN
jgi:hypothetical protein